MTASARRSALLFAFALACLATVLALNAQPASSASWKSCSLSSNDKKPRKHGPTYLKKLRVKGGPSCAGGKNLVKAYFDCRTKGPKTVRSRCTKKVHGYKCGESRRNVIASSFDATVMCAKGSRRVYHKYQQLTD